MNEPEYLAESAKLCETMGKRPEWEDEGHIHRLTIVPGNNIAACIDWKDHGGVFGWAFRRTWVSLHQAACIFENLWRVWLEEQGVAVMRTLSPTTEAYYRYNLARQKYITSEQTLSMNREDAAIFDTYHEAQIAAVKHEMEASE